MIRSTSPFTQITTHTFTPLSNQEVTERIVQANGAYKELKSTDFSQRAQWMNRAAEILENNKEEYARMITHEMGKLITESVGEVEKCAWVCRYYAVHAEQFAKDEIILTDASKSYVTYGPIGIVLAVMPWNFPLWQVFRFAAPALMLGNTGLLKHASNVPQCALAIEKVFRDAGFPKGCFSTLLIETEQVEQVIAHPAVRAITLTGSGPAGKAVASIAAKHLKKSVLELGGSDPYIILEDAEVEKAAEICAKGRLLNAGQSCIGAKRFIAVKEVYNTFLSEFRRHMEAAKFGDPESPKSTLAPMASIKARDDLHNQVLKSITQGAHLLTGGYIPQEIESAFYPPTILIEVSKNNLAYSEELFGPVAVVFRVEDEDEAIALANDTSFGLGACVFTEDKDRGELIAREKLEAGCCFVNAGVKSDPRLPFGGIKDSGFGRELGSHGMLEFANAKTVYIK